MVKDGKIGIAMDFSNSSKNTLKWAIDNLADKGDTLFIIHISHNALDESRDKFWFLFNLFNFLCNYQYFASSCTYGVLESCSFY
ncbi:hypothetical protein UlMin_031739 [Ulmus minor]